MENTDKNSGDLNKQKLDDLNFNQRKSDYIKEKTDIVIDYNNSRKNKTDYCHGLSSLTGPSTNHRSIRDSATVHKSGWQDS